MSAARPMRALLFSAPLDYVRTAALQEHLVAARLRDDIPDTVLFLEHLPVITLGARGNRDHLVADEAALRARGIALAHATRGGDITYHAPGQLVMYPVIKLGEREADAHGYMHNLEEIAIRTVRDCGVTAFRRPGKTGAWTEQGKIAALGVRLKRWVTCHGLALNIDVELDGFSLIVPCGLQGERVTSLLQILGTGCPAVHEVRAMMMRHFGDVCGRPITEGRAGESYLDGGTGANET
jgi:lipoyl(octanoyl) transferase